MPIFLKDELIGVVGIFGCEEQMSERGQSSEGLCRHSILPAGHAQKQNVESEVRTAF